MATWTNPNSITPATKIADTDDSLQGSMDDLEAFVNGTSPYSSVTGLTSTLVDKTSAQTISGSKTFTTAIVATGGVTGDLTGDSTGLHTGDVVGDISVIPNGIIVMWSGSVASIPNAQGWYLCDGTNGTINLTDKFVVAAGTAYAVADTGGADSNTLLEANLPAHNHSISLDQDAHTHTGTTDLDGSHGHKQSAQFNVLGTGTSSAGNYFPRGNASDPVAPTGIDSATDHTHTFTTASDSHTHVVNETTVGSGTAVENRPAFYALAYIQKV